MNKYWFRPKKYGYGAYPITWEGWLTTLIFIFLIFANVSLAEYDQGMFLFNMALMIAVLIVICKWKTEGEWKWRWG